MIYGNLSLFVSRSAYLEPEKCLQRIALLTQLTAIKVP